ncbi:glycoprotein-N-acetylgalactosamine 3-beta-galactosyltransferase 1-like [Bactrocera neohumeralis]|uniref:glycoprotein-N-acetylgalactosamine 3-beta-galactosyltransferase 1-like n=1 Tax=Bactrocera neohumeralis TaxID=98809 RepID=UPI0021654064|nr:glycoprotein-N-acetylgalactosamine 3-beta-galactosyltransferase 1-like [Bactrocera neohumeralis]
MAAETPMPVRKRRLLVHFITGLVIGALLAVVVSFWRPYRRELIQANTRYRHSHMVAMKNDNNSIPTDLSQAVRVLCWIVTNREHHKSRAQHVKRTWGRRCNKLIFVSWQNDQESGIKQEDSLNSWSKIQAVLKYIYANHLDEADWFFRADDRTYAIMENMRYFLHTYSPETPIYFGHKAKDHISANAGYVLSKAALWRFVEKALPNDKLCIRNSTRTETVELGECLKNVGVMAADSRDQHGCARFVSFHLNKYLTSWRRDYTIFKSAEDLTCCSQTAIAYNFVMPYKMYLLDHFIYHMRTNNTVIAPISLPLR